MSSALVADAVPSSTVEFVSMCPGDIEAVLAAEQRIYEFPWTRGNFDDSLASGYSAWLMCDSGFMLGYAVMLLVLDEVQLLNISIVPERQKAGFGRQLLEYLLVLARKQGAKRMLLEVRLSNAIAHAFYIRHGFVQIGTRPDYYPAREGREAARVMERVL